MPSPERHLTPAERAALGEIAREALAAATTGRPYQLPESLRRGRLAERGASFVSLHAGGELRGCIGSLAARRPLADDVAANARAAAVEDYRFSPLDEAELAALEVEISVLTPAVPLPVRTETELLARLRPGVDGLVLEEGERRATFLPIVWKQLPSPADFVIQLKRKAGLPPDYWSSSLRFSRYLVEEFPAGTAGAAAPRPA